MTATLSPRPVAAAVLLVLGVGLAVAAYLMTPWQPLGRPVPAAAVQRSVLTDFTSAEATRAQRMRARVRPPALVALAVGLVVVLGVGLTPIGSRFLTVLSHAMGNRAWAVVSVGTGAVTLLARLVQVPLDAHNEIVAREYGLSTRSWGLWALDSAKGWAISWLLAAFALVLLVYLARLMPVWWWLAAAVGAAALVVLLSFAYPLVVEPLFNRFTPMPSTPLRAQLLRLAESEGVAVSDVLVADASRRTTGVNAYVSGLGSSRRLVVYDTLLRSADPREVALVVAHELGHVRHRDVAHGTALGAVGAAAAVCLLQLLVTWRPLGSWTRTATPADPRSALLVLALVTLVMTLTGPAQCLISRRIEASADVAALNLTGDPDDFARMQRRLALTNISDLTPPAILFGLFATHPTAPQRIALAREWARAHDVAVPGPLVQ